MQRLFRSEALDLASWGAILALGAVVFLAIETEKAILRRIGVHRI